MECFADHVGGGRFLPPAVPQSLAEDDAGLRRLLAIESDRTRYARSNPTAVVVLDRSVHTLLAHRYALDRVTGLGCYEHASRMMAGADIPTWPDLVLYLDVPQDVVLDRNKGKFADDSIFINPTFNSGIRGYYRRLVDQGSPVVWIDAAQNVQQTLERATSYVTRLLQGQHA
ncbi:hypothetical protein ACN28C_10865 [Plantactinospora sp. WMMC1484]|uniref:hypothetical protein n=1 Tax=Plantactinospora sp. WMMC1484 TaxID=3404122 RepID=UPI003BF493A7